MKNLRCTIYDVQCAMYIVQCKYNNIKFSVLKFSVLLFFFILFSSIQAQTNVIDSIDLSKNITTTDSIFNDNINLKEKQFSEKDTINKLVDSTKSVLINDTNDTANLVSINKKIKKQKKIDTTHYSPKKAAIWAASFPGLGQIYMKKYWKLPIVYGAIGAVLYFVVSNGQNLRKYNGYIRNVYDSVPNPSPIDQLTLSNIETRRNTYRKNVQIASFGTLFAWGLSIVDAVVDAHLHSFDISDKLAIKVRPQINYSNFTYYSGIGLNLTIK